MAPLTLASAAFAIAHAQFEGVSLLQGLAPNPDYSPVQQSWDNRFAAFVEKTGELDPLGRQGPDRHCTLSAWTRWTPCSMACGGGVQEKRKHVLIPSRGDGRCPLETSRSRYRTRECNRRECRGDEICVARQDLVVAIDGSGSISEDGFAVLKGFASKLVDRYQGEYFGEDAMQIGVVQFGNGVVMEDDTVSPAVNVQPITSDLAAAKSAIEGLSLQNGFNNMAQAFALSETMFSHGGSQKRHSAVLVITDGNSSFENQTAELVTQLQDEGVQRFFVVVTDSSSSRFYDRSVTDYEDDGLEKMREWASEPWDTNLIHVHPRDLQSDEDIYVARALVRFCPMSGSPSRNMWSEFNYGYLLVRRGGYCGGRGALLARHPVTVEVCAGLANGVGAGAFLFSTRFSRCHASDMAVDEGQFSAWYATRQYNDYGMLTGNTPACPSGWETTRVYDFYGIAPATQ